MISHIVGSRFGRAIGRRGVAGAGPAIGRMPRDVSLSLCHPLELDGGSMHRAYPPRAVAGSRASSDKGFERLKWALVAVSTLSSVLLVLFLELPWGG